MKLSEALTKYEKYVRVTKSKGTYRFTKGKSKTLLEHFGNIECEEIDRTEILDLIIFLRERNNTISNASINKYIGLLLRILKNECNIILEFDTLRPILAVLKSKPPVNTDIFPVFQIFVVVRKCFFSPTFPGNFVAWHF